MAYNMRDDIKEVYFTEEQLRDKVRELGARITEDYRGKNPLIVSVLKGSYIFMSDLTRAIDTPCNVDFMVVSSYGNGTKTSGEVQIIKDIAQPIDGRDLLIVEDILDSGVTLHYLMQILAHAARTPSVCARSCPSRSAARSTSTSIIWALRSRTSSLSATVWTTRKSTAICRTSVFSSRTFTAARANNLPHTERGVKPI